MTLHEEQVDYANRLVEANHMTAYHSILADILYEHCEVELTGEQALAVVEALANPVAFACSETAERNRKWGMHIANEDVARRLGLGALAPYDGH